MHGQYWVTWLLGGHLNSMVDENHIQSEAANHIIWLWPAKVYLAQWPEKWVGQENVGLYYLIGQARRLLLEIKMALQMSVTHLPKSLTILLLSVLGLLLSYLPLITFALPLLNQRSESYP